MSIKKENYSLQTSRGSNCYKCGNVLPAGAIITERVRSPPHQRFVEHNCLSCTGPFVAKAMLGGLDANEHDLLRTAPLTPAQMASIRADLETAVAAAKGKRKVNVPPATPATKKQKPAEPAPAPPAPQPITVPPKCSDHTLAMFKEQNKARDLAIKSLALKMLSSGDMTEAAYLVTLAAKE